MFCGIMRVKGTNCLSVSQVFAVIVIAIKAGVDEQKKTQDATSR